VRRLAAVGLGAACALAFAGTTGAAIVLNRGIGGVNLGMTQSQVRAKRGKPPKIVHGKNEFGSYTEYRYPGYTIDFQQNDTVTSIVTTLARERTPAGAGVGSTWAQVHAKVPRVHCSGSPNLGECHVGALLPGKRVTDFFFALGKVNRVVVGIVLD
jgi:hypothetical protein